MKHRLLTFTLVTVLSLAAAAPLAGFGKQPRPPHRQEMEHGRSVPSVRR